MPPTPLDITDPLSIAAWGTNTTQSVLSLASHIMTTIRQQRCTSPILDTVGAISARISSMSLAITTESKWVRWLRSDRSRIREFIQLYGEVENEIYCLSSSLRDQRDDLKTYIKVMDQLYHTLATQMIVLTSHITTAEDILRDIGSLPTEDTSGSTDPLVALAHSEQVQNIHQLEIKLHDLRLTKTVMLQMMTQLKLTQNADVATISQINNILSGTIPLWSQSVTSGLQLPTTHQQITTLAAISISCLSDLNAIKAFKPEITNPQIENASSRNF